MLNNNTINNNNKGRREGRDRNRQTSSSFRESTNSETH